MKIYEELDRSKKDSTLFIKRDLTYMMYSPQNFVSWSIELLTILWPNLNIKLSFKSGIYVIFSQVKKILNFLMLKNS